MGIGEEIRQVPRDIAEGAEEKKKTQLGGQHLLLYTPSIENPSFSRPKRLFWGIVHDWTVVPTLGVLRIHDKNAKRLGFFCLSKASSWPAPSRNRLGQT